MPRFRGDTLIPIDRIVTQAPRRRDRKSRASPTRNRCCSDGSRAKLHVLSQFCARRAIAGKQVPVFQQSPTLSPRLRLTDLQRRCRCSADSGNRPAARAVPSRTKSMAYPPATCYAALWLTTR
ncbi:MAG: hypothetical protein MZV70_33710 [Desulfobacterales bacterium]|nr:hypothetical protein [Desulfobacterales bacterium]